MVMVMVILPHAYRGAVMVIGYGYGYGYGNRERIQLCVRVLTLKALFSSFCVKGIRNLPPSVTNWAGKLKMR